MPGAARAITRRSSCGSVLGSSADEGYERGRPSRAAVPGRRDRHRQEECAGGERPARGRCAARAAAGRRIATARLLGGGCSALLQAYAATASAAHAAPAQARRSARPARRRLSFPRAPRDSSCAAERALSEGSFADCRVDGRQAGRPMLALSTAAALEIVDRLRLKEELASNTNFNIHQVRADRVHVDPDPQTRPLRNVDRAGCVRQQMVRGELQR